MRCPKCNTKLHFRARGSEDRSRRFKWVRRVGGRRRRRGCRGPGWESMAHAVQANVPIGPERKPGYSLACANHATKQETRVVKGLPDRRICQMCARYTGMPVIAMGCRRVKHVRVLRP
jgi:hypothetical protein